MLMRQNIQNNDCLTINTLYRVLSSKMKRALFNHLVLLSFNTTFQRIQEFYVTFFFWFLEWVLQIFLIFVYTLRPDSDAVLHMSRIECKWRKTKDFAHLHLIRLMWSTASELGLKFSSHKQWVEIFQVLTADKIRFPLLLVSCFISLFRPKDLTFPIFFLNVFDRKLLLNTSSKNFNG